MSAEPTPEKPSSPLREIIQPFIDLAHAPRALWGINLAYVIEGMVYFGMLGYLTIYCSEFVFQAIDGADEVAHYMVMVLTAGITIAMFFLGVVADRRGVRFALIAAFILMLIGRFVWAGGPTLFGLEPVRPAVFAGDKVSLHVTKLDTRFGNKAITKADVIAAAPGDPEDIEHDLKLELSAGEGIALSPALESRLVRLDRARLITGEDQEWEARYGSREIKARVLISAAKQLGLAPGSTITLDRAYVAAAKKGGKDKQQAADAGETGSGAEPGPEDGGGDGGETDGTGHPYVVRSQWLSDVGAVDTFPIDLAEGAGIAPGEAMQSWGVRLSTATIADGGGLEWGVQYGQAPVNARLVLRTKTAPPLAPGAVLSVNRARVVKRKKDKSDEFVIEVHWPEGIAAVDVSDCANAAEIREAIRSQLIPDLSLGAGTPLNQNLTSGPVQLGMGRLVQRVGSDWQVEYGSGPVRARLHIDADGVAGLGPGALISLRRANVVSVSGDTTPFRLRARWPDDVAAVNTYGCEESPYRELVTADERKLQADSRGPVATDADALREATPATIADLRGMDDGVVDVVLPDVHVTYVRNGGYFLQADKDGPAIFVFVSPLWSPLQVVTLLGILLVIVGYGMYQPAAYAGVRKFTTPKTAAMGFAMLYALMNLGGWLPTFAFLLRDDNYAGLGIPGMFWVYTGFTVVALVATVIILNRRTVADAENAARTQTERIRAEAQKENPDRKPEPPDAGAAAGVLDAARVKPHMWLFWLAAMALFLFKGEAPWYYSWTELNREWITRGFGSMVVWRWILAGLVFLWPLLIASWPKAKRWVARHPLQDGKFAYFIFALIPVQTLFTYNWLVLPPYIKRAYEGWIGNYFEIAANANPILIFIAVPIITAITQKRKVYNMMIVGTFIMAAPAFLLTIGPHWWTLFIYIFIMTIGEAMWQPRFLQYAAEIAPEGRTGEYMGVAQLPWFLTKVLVPLLYSGRMMDLYCPAEGPKNTETMWLIFACIAMTSTVLLILAKRWIGKDFKTKAA
jgi:hypothetical protein